MRRTRQAVGPDPEADAADRALWSAVVLQAKDDVASLPMASLEHHAAVSFLTSDAAGWAQARTEVARHLHAHADDIRRAGEAWVKARRRVEPLAVADCDAPADDEPGKPARLPRRAVWRANPLTIPPLLRETLWLRRKPAKPGQFRRRY
jgi:hypothetical protein